MTKNIRRDDWQTLQPTIFGWGINDVNYSVTKYTNVSDTNRQKQVWLCPYYKHWKGLLQRCLDEKLKNKFESYKNCTVCKEWQYLSNFIEWVDSQPNRDWQNCELDKDFIFVGNKHYSPETCVFIPQELNSFITNSGKSRGKMMIGVSDASHRNANKPYQARCSNPFTKKVDYLGMFPTEIEAHLAWKHKKHEHACALAEFQDDIRVANTLRAMYL